MFQQLLTPVAEQPAALIPRRGAPGRGGPRAPRRLATASVAILARRTRRRVRHRDRGLEPSRSLSPYNAIPNGVVFALWPVMWIVVNALLLYNIAVESNRFDAFARGYSTICPTTAGRARRDRFLLRRAARRNRRFWHPDRDYRVAPHFGRLSGARGDRIRADLQHRPGRLRRARRASHGAGRGHRAPVPPRRDDRPAVAVHRAPAALLRDGALWRRALAASAVAGAAGRRRLLRAHPVHRVELHQLRVDRRPVVARFADRDAAVPSGLEASARSGIRRDGRKPTWAMRIRISARGKAGFPG